MTAPMTAPALLALIGPLAIVWALAVATPGPNFFAITQVVTDAMTRVDVDKTDDAASSWTKALQDFDALGLQ